MADQRKIKILSLFFALCMLCACVLALQISAVAAEDGAYTCAQDVEYKYFGSYSANWGKRGEACGFLSPKALDFYNSQDYAYKNVSVLDGGSSQDDAHASRLYAELQAIMRSEHSHQTSYRETRDLYKYTDCERNNTAKISSFYSGHELNGAWDSGKTWNREHTWPNSKGLGGSDEDDIMMLRPTWVSENSSRGNAAYGISQGFFEPEDHVKGDCARIALYVYTRWGNTSKMWGTAGMIESVEVLLSWIELDPVDTWEMGRNDSVESITGARNVFVDYPEYAFLLFGEEIPEDMVTPSGNSASGGHDNEKATETESAVIPETNAQTEADPQSEQESDGVQLNSGCGATLGTGAAVTLIAVSLAWCTLFGKKDKS